MVHPRLLGVTLVLALLALLASGGASPALEANQTPGKPKPPAGGKPKAPPAASKYGHRHVWRVQIRHPGWKTFAKANANTSDGRTIIARTTTVLRANGWQTRVKNNSKNIVHVQGRMPAWRMRAVTLHHRIAEGMARVLRAQGFRVRII